MTDEDVEKTSDDVLPVADEMLMGGMGGGEEVGKKPEKRTKSPRRNREKEG